MKQALRWLNVVTRAHFLNYDLTRSNVVEVDFNESVGTATMPSATGNSKRLLPNGECLEAKKILWKPNDGDRQVRLT